MSEILFLKKNRHTFQLSVFSFPSIFLFYPFWGGSPRWEFKNTTSPFTKKSYRDFVSLDLRHEAALRCRSFAPFRPAPRGLECWCVCRRTSSYRGVSALEQPLSAPSWGVNGFFFQTNELFRGNFSGFVPLATGEHRGDI
jgi:hypothetical protein